MKFFCLLLSVLLLVASPAQAYPPVQETASPQGITAWLMESHQLPIVTLHLHFTRAGYAYDPAGHEGLATALTEMLMEGAGDYNAQQFHAQLDEYAIAPDIDADAEDLSVTIKFLSNHADRAMELLNAMLQTPHLKQEALEKVKQRLAVARRQRMEDPAFLASQTLQQQAFEGHALARDPLGTEQSIAAITPNDLRRFMKNRLTRDRLTVVAAGDVTPATLNTWMDKALGGLPAAGDGTAELPKTQVNNKKVHHTAIASGQSVISFAADGLPRSHPDFYALYVLNEILGGGGFQTVLTQILREKEGLVYSVGTYLDDTTIAPTLRGQLATRPDQADRAIALLKKTLADLAGGGISDDAVENAKTHIIGSLPLNTDTTGKLAQYLLSMRRHGLGKDYLDMRAEHFRKVTHADVQRLAKDILNPDRFIISIAGPQEKKP